jgi:hypothetical protein
MGDHHPDMYEGDQKSIIVLANLTAITTTTVVNGISVLGVFRAFAMEHCLTSPGAFVSPYSLGCGRYTCTE